MLLYSRLELSPNVSIKIIEARILSMKKDILRFKPIDSDEKLCMLNETERILKNTEMKRAYDILGDNIIDFLLKASDAELYCMAISKENIGMALLYALLITFQVAILPCVYDLNSIIAYTPFLLSVFILAYLAITLTLLYPKDTFSNLFLDEVRLAAEETLILHLQAAFCILILGSNIGFRYLAIGGLMVSTEISAAMRAQNIYQKMISTEEKKIQMLQFRVSKLLVFMLCVMPGFLFINLFVLSVASLYIYNRFVDAFHRSKKYAALALMYFLYVEFIHLAPKYLFFSTYTIFSVLPFVLIVMRGVDALRNISLDLTEHKRLVGIV
jgi:hypothetical protein